MIEDVIRTGKIESKEEFTLCVNKGIENLYKLNAVNGRIPIGRVDTSKDELTTIVRLYENVFYPRINIKDDFVIEEEKDISGMMLREYRFGMIYRVTFFRHKSDDTDLVFNRLLMGLYHLDRQRVVKPIKINTGAYRGEDE